jgi:hypothetical protein
MIGGIVGALIVLLGLALVAAGSLEDVATQLAFAAPGVVCILVGGYFLYRAIRRVPTA